MRMGDNHWEGERSNEKWEITNEKGGGEEKQSEMEEQWRGGDKKWQEVLLHIPPPEVLIS